jgi:hypothetical protein
MPMKEEQNHDLRQKDHDRSDTGDDALRQARSRSGPSAMRAET